MTWAGGATLSYSDLFFKYILTEIQKTYSSALLHFPHFYDGLSHTKCSGQDWCVAYSVFHKVYSFVLNGQ